MVTYDQLKNLISELSERPIAYQRIYAKITGSVTSGLLLSQLVYWQKTCPGKPFYKTNEQFRDELWMGREEFKAAKKNLINLGLIETQLRGVPAMTYYQVNMDEITRQILDFTGHQLVGGKPANWMAENPPTITETTRDTPYNPPLEDSSPSSRSQSAELPLDSGEESGDSKNLTAEVNIYPLAVSSSEKHVSLPPAAKKTPSVTVPTSSSSPDPSWTDICNHMLNRNNAFQHWTSGITFRGIVNGRLKLECQNVFWQEYCEKNFGEDLLLTCRKLKMGVSFVEFYVVKT